MFDRIRRWLGGTSTRSYDGAQGGRRFTGMPSMPSPVSSSHVSRYTLAARARYLVSNNPLAAAAVQAWCAQAVGAGIKPVSTHADPAIRETLTARFAAWTDVAAADGRTDWYGIQNELFRSMVITGEGLAILINSDRGLRIRVLDPEQLDASHAANLTGGGYIIQGVEFNAQGERVAYHILSQPPGLELGIQRRSERIPADDVIHLYRQDWPSAVRGISFFSPALLRIADLDSWRDAQLVRQKVAAMLAGFVTSSDGSGSPLEGEQDGSNLIGGLSPGHLAYLAPGEEITFSQPANIGSEVIEFAAICEREIAAALGLPAHIFGDVTRANYSSLKSANTAWKARVEALQWSTFVFQVCLPVWRRFVTLDVLAGNVTTNVDAAMPVKHVCPQFPSLEPVKEITAQVMELKAGLTSRRALLAARGEDAEQVDADIAADQARATSLGLTFAASDNAAVDDEAA